MLDDVRTRLARLLCAGAGADDDVVPLLRLVGRAADARSAPEDRVRPSPDADRVPRAAHASSPRRVAHTRRGRPAPRRVRRTVRRARLRRRAVRQARSHSTPLCTLLVLLTERRHVRAFRVRKVCVCPPLTQPRAVRRLEPRPRAVRAARYLCHLCACAPAPGRTPRIAHAPRRAGHGAERRAPRALGAHAPRPRAARDGTRAVHACRR